MKIVFAFICLLLTTCVLSSMIRKKNNLLRREVNTKTLLRNLLDFNSKEGSEDLITLKKELLRYLANPFKDGKPFPVNEYLELAKSNNVTTESCKQDKVAQEFKFLCKQHAGNLAHHSQWTALQIKKWKKQNDPIVKDINVYLAMITAFFHDIGKGGDCNFLLYEGAEKKKYDGKGDAVHPEFSGDMILGLKKFYVCPETSENSEDNKSKKEINIRKLVESFFPTTELQINGNLDYTIKTVAFVAYMHWEFGKLNIKKGKDDERSEEEYKQFTFKVYMDLFMKIAKKLQIKPTTDLLKLTIAVSCADISGASNWRVKEMDITLPEPYASSDSWVSFGMDKNYINHADSLILYSKKVEEFDGLKKRK